MAENLLRSHFDQLFTTPERGAETVADTTPTATPTAPATPTDVTASTAPLEMFLRYITSGQMALTPEMYNYFGGDAILEAVKKYDPSAHFEDVEIGGGEGGSQGIGKKLIWRGAAEGVDQSGLPTSPRGRAGFDLNPANLHANLKPGVPGSYVDPIYGSVRNSFEFAPDSREALDIWGPLAVSALTLGAGALPAVAGVSTGAVTGGAAGLAAGNIASAGATPWWSQVLAKAPTLARQITPPTASVPDQFNAASFNKAGSAAKPSSNDSSLVATQFAADPYGNSQQ